MLMARMLPSQTVAIACAALLCNETAKSPTSRHHMLHARARVLQMFMLHELHNLGPRSSSASVKLEGEACFLCTGECVELGPGMCLWLDPEPGCIRPWHQTPTGKAASKLKAAGVQDTMCRSLDGKLNALPILWRQRTSTQLRIS